jgi:hypothetical protein
MKQASSTMRSRARAAATACLALMLAACATVPAQRAAGIADTLPLVVTKDEAHVRIAVHVDRDVVGPGARFAAPTVEIAEGARPETVEPSSARLVANNAARSLCNELAPYVELVAPGSDGALRTRLVVTAITPTSRAAAGASALVDVFVPGPARPPAGLGALAIDGEVRDPADAPVAAIRWARGANPVTDNAQVSAIGDAWQLADTFGEEFARLLLRDAGDKNAPRPPRLAAAVVRANRARCAEWFGALNLAALGAGRLVPLAPEAIDPGPPAAKPSPAPH